MVGYTSQKVGIRNGYVLDALMAGLHPNVDQMKPCGVKITFLED